MAPQSHLNDDLDPPTCDGHASAVAGSDRIRLAIVDDYEIVVLGLGALLRTEDDIDVVELSADGTVDRRDLDIVLYDTFGAADPDLCMVRSMIDDRHVAKVVVYTWNFDDRQIRRALDLGVCGYLSKSLNRDDLVAALRRVQAGEVVVSVHADARTSPGTERRWPGQGMELTEKEADVLALITQGHDNASIAEMLFISPNTLKTRVRNLYRKIGADSRVQAALWGVKHGFEPDKTVPWSGERSA